MRIGIDARPLATPTTGIGRYTLEIVRRLAESEHELYLYTVAPLKVELPTPTTVVRCLRSQFPLMNTVFSQTVFARWARQDAIDVFWSPRHHVPLLSSAPSVVTIHDLVWRLYGETMIRMGRLIESLLMPPSLRKARKIIAVSESTAEDIVRFYPGVADKITVIPEAACLTGIEPDSAKLPLAPYILFVGTMEPRKNLSRIVQAFQKLRDTDLQNHRFVVVGNRGWKNEADQKLLNDPSIADRIDQLGQVTDAQLAALYVGADFVVATSLYEGFGLVPLEAMQFGTPVITSDLSAFPEVVGDAALLVEPTSVPSIAEAMARLAGDRALHAALAHRGVERSRQFSWDRAARDTLALLESAGSAPGRGPG